MINVPNKDYQRFLELEETLKSCPMYSKGMRASDFVYDYVKWFNGQRCMALNMPIDGVDDNLE